MAGGAETPHIVALLVIALLGNLAAFCRWRTSSADVTSAATSAVRASGLGSGQFNFSAALYSSSPEAIAHGLTVGDGNRGKIDEPGGYFVGQATDDVPDDFLNGDFPCFVQRSGDGFSGVAPFVRSLASWLVRLAVMSLTQRALKGGSLRQKSPCLRRD
ncbi:MAG: hypothetical protein U1E81_10660 [Xanthobacteraceae bacterium]